jgi:serine protease Do
MTLMRARRATAVAILALSVMSARAADTNEAKWDPVRTTFPTTTGELKSLQAAVKQVVEKTTSATVGILIRMGGLREKSGAGSGVIVSDDGLVLTAAHVVGWSGQDCQVVLPDGTRVRAVTLGVNHDTDAGMLRITGAVPKNATWTGASLGKWPHDEVGPSADLKKNQWVVSLGHPGGPKPDRRPPVRVGQFLASARDALESDCTLVGGDSGGPLFDLNGKVIGIHSRIGRTLDNNIHVPTDSFKKDWAELADGQTVSSARSVIGVTLRRKTNEPTHPKAIIDDLSPDGPAAKAGLKVGDVITRLNGYPVHSSEAFDGIMQVIEREEPPGFGGRFTPPSRLRKIEVERDGETKKFDVTAVRRTAQPNRRPATTDKLD